jgi:DNA-binding MarR family transcriptional regulator
MTKCSLVPYFWTEPISLVDPHSIDRFLLGTSHLQAGLVVIDPLAPCLEGLQEKDNSDMQIAANRLNTIRNATGGALLVVHHAGWDTTHERGATALRGACRVVAKLSQDDTGLIAVESAKANNGDFAPRYFRLVQQPTGIYDDDGIELIDVAPIVASKVRLKDAPISARQFEIMECLNLAQYQDGGATFTQIKEHTEISPSTINKSIDTLIHKQLVGKIETRNNRKLYGLTMAGRAELERLTGGEQHGEQTGEQLVNWVVKSPPAKGDIPLPGAEFTPVHPDHFDSSPAVCSPGSPDSEQSKNAPESDILQDSSPCSPAVHLFVHPTSSPVHPPVCL